jgi:hypothetical protein
MRQARTDTVGGMTRPAYAVHVAPKGTPAPASYDEPLHPDFRFAGATGDLPAWTVDENGVALEFNWLDIDAPQPPAHQELVTVLEGRQDGGRLVRVCLTLAEFGDDRRKAYGRIDEASNFAYRHFSERAAA